MSPEQTIAEFIVAIGFLLIAFELGVHFTTRKSGWATKLMKWMAGKLTRLVQWLAQQSWKCLKNACAFLYQIAKQLSQFGVAYARRKGWIR